MLKNQGVGRITGFNIMNCIFAAPWTIWPVYETSSTKRPGLKITSLLTTPKYYYTVCSFLTILFPRSIYDRMEDMTQIDDMMFQPFGAGPRNCIGMAFAEIEIKLAMCRVLHSYSFEPCDDTPVCFRSHENMSIVYLFCDKRFRLYVFCCTACYSVFKLCLEVTCLTMLDAL